VPSRGLVMRGFHLGCMMLFALSCDWLRLANPMRYRTSTQTKLAFRRYRCSHLLRGRGMAISVRAFLGFLSRGTLHDEDRAMK